MTTVNSVIILGAGASSSDGAPLQKNIIKKFWKGLTIKTFENYEGLSITEKIQLENIKEYFKLFWGADLLSPFDRYYEYPTFEDCLGLLEIAKNRNENFGLKNREKLNTFRNSLIFLIAKAIEEELAYSKSHNHQNLIDRLINEEVLKSTAFISLNYDIIVDNILTKLQESNDLDLDYGIEFMNFYRNQNSNEENTWKRPDPKNQFLS